MLEHLDGIEFKVVYVLRDHMQIAKSAPGALRFDELAPRRLKFDPPPKFLIESSEEE